ncbi:hypothetical protein EYZ11_011542 [Aspergillus tanneri]|nr:hypothetical protein EYZ11_011542 [Aspergillus tanneri]
MGDSGDLARHGRSGTVDNQQRPPGWTRYFDNIIPYSVKQKRCYRCNDLATWRGPAKNQPDVDNAQDGMSAAIALRE